MPMDGIRMVCIMTHPFSIHRSPYFLVVSEACPHQHWFTTACYRMSKDSSSTAPLDYADGWQLTWVSSQALSSQTISYMYTSSRDTATPFNCRHRFHNWFADRKGFCRANLLVTIFAKLNHTAIWRNDCPASSVPTLISSLEHDLVSNTPARTDFINGTMYVSYTSNVLYLRESCLFQE